MSAWANSAHPLEETICKFQYPTNLNVEELRYKRVYDKKDEGVELRIKRVKQISKKKGISMVDIKFGDGTEIIYGTYGE